MLYINKYFMIVQYIALLAIVDLSLVIKISSFISNIVKIWQLYTFNKKLHNKIFFIILQ